MQQLTNHHIEGNTTQDNWLDITYTTRKYSVDEAKPKAKPSRRRGAIQTIALTCICLAILAGAMFLSMDNGILSMAKTTYLATFTQTTQSSKTIDIALPYNVNVTTVDNGVITFNGSKILLSFTDGNVSAVEEGTITVNCNDDVTMVYSGVVECYVAVGSTVEFCDVLAKYDGDATVTITKNGEAVSDIVASQYQLQWSV